MSLIKSTYFEFASTPVTENPLFSNKRKANPVPGPISKRFFDAGYVSAQTQTHILKLHDCGNKAAAVINIYQNLRYILTLLQHELKSGSDSTFKTISKLNKMLVIMDICFRVEDIYKSVCIVKGIEPVVLKRDSSLRWALEGLSTYRSFWIGGLQQLAFLKQMKHY